MEGNNVAKKRVVVQRLGATRELITRATEYNRVWCCTAYLQRVFYLLMDTERISESVVRGQLAVVFALCFTSMIYCPRDFCVCIIPSAAVMISSRGVGIILRTPFENTQPDKEPSLFPFSDVLIMRVEGRNRRRVTLESEAYDEYGRVRAASLTFVVLILSPRQFLIIAINI